MTGYRIVSVYPGAATLVAPHDIFDGMYLPNEQDGAQKAKVTSLYLLWMRDLALDNVSGFTHNHFVPLCFKASKDQGLQKKRKNVEKSLGTVKKKFKLENYWGQGKNDNEEKKAKATEKSTKESFFSKFKGLNTKIEEKREVKEKKTVPDDKANKEIPIKPVKTNVTKPNLKTTDEIMAQKQTGVRLSSLFLQKGKEATKEL